MAEIKIRKKRSPVWAWLLALVVIVAAGVLVYLLVFDNPSTEAVNTPADNRVQTTNNTY